MTPRILVAGVGNVFFGDDGFGVEAARRLEAEPLPAGVKAVDYGIRGMHLAYEILSGYDLVILVDAIPRGEEPGTLFIIEPDLESSVSAPPDAHSMDLQNVFAFMRALGGAAPPIRVVGCEPGALREEIGLSEPVENAVGRAIDVVRSLIQRRLSEDTVTC